MLRNLFIGAPKAIWSIKSRSNSLLRDVRGLFYAKTIKKHFLHQNNDNTSCTLECIVRMYEGYNAKWNKIKWLTKISHVVAKSFLEVTESKYTTYRMARMDKQHGWRITWATSRKLYNETYSGWKVEPWWMWLTLIQDSIAIKTSLIA